MHRFWLYSFVCLLVQVLPSCSIALSPCKVNNVLAQPLYGTSLRTKNIVQIIQIPPVFVQNVLVGKCENANEKVAGSAGDHFQCRQRYSAVEVYITQEERFFTNANQIDKNYPNTDMTPAVQVIKRTSFVRDSVVVESGCDFSFNLLPLLLGQKKAEHEGGHKQDELKDNFQFLKSPHHSILTANPIHPASLPLAQVVVDPTIFQTSDNEYYNPSLHSPTKIEQGGNEIPTGEEGTSQNSHFPTYNGGNQHTYPKINVTTVSDNPADLHKLLAEQNRLKWQKLQSHIDNRSGKTEPQASASPVGSVISTDEHISRPSGPHSPGSHKEANSPNANPPGSSDHGSHHGNVPNPDLVPARNFYDRFQERAEEKHFNHSGQYQDPQKRFQQVPNQSHRQESSGNRDVGRGEVSNDVTYSHSTLSANTANQPGPSAENLQFVPINTTKSGEYGPTYKGLEHKVGNDGGIISLSYPVIGNNFQPDGNHENGHLGMEAEASGYPTEHSIGGKETYLQTLPHKIGLPLLILSRGFDPLMKNVDTEAKY